MILAEKWKKKGFEYGSTKTNTDGRENVQPPRSGQRASELERRHGGRGGGEGPVLLLAPHLEHLAVGVGVDAAHVRRAARRAVLGEEPAGLVADAARVAQRLGALRSRAPLRGLLDAAVAAAPVALGGGLHGTGGVGREVLRLAPALLGLVLGLLVLVLAAWRFVKEVEGGGVH